MIVRLSRSAFFVILVISLMLIVNTLIPVKAEESVEHTMPTDPFGTYLIAHGGQIRGAAEMSTIGARWTSIYLSWRSVESSPGIYDWSSWDQVLADATAHDLQVILSVTTNPDWAAETSCGPIYAEHLPTFANFLTAAVQRYSTPPYNILHWALYNEPDNSDAVTYQWVGGCWGDASNPKKAPGASGYAYAEMLSFAYPAIKTGNPDAQVVLGGLAYDWFVGIDKGGVFDPEFLSDVLKGGGAQYFDIMNFHYFPASDWRWNDDSGGFDRYNRGLAFKTNWIQEEEFKNYATKPIMCSEAGKTSINHLGEDHQLDQARFVVKLNARAMSVDIFPMIYFEGVDEPWLGIHLRYMGLLTKDMEPKLSYYTYQTMVQELSGAQFVRVRDDLFLRFEGYEFNINGRTKNVIWHTSDKAEQIALAVSQPGGIMRVVEMDGSESLVQDGGAGDLDGWVNGYVGVNVIISPRYFEDLSMPMDTPTHTPTPTSSPTPTFTPSATPTLQAHSLFLPLLLTAN